MTGRREGPDITLIKVAIAEHRRLFDLDWNLPIAFERDGEMLIGRLHMEVSCDLMKMGREQAERDIALVIKNALLGYALEPKPLRMTHFFGPPRKYLWNEKTKRWEVQLLEDEP